MAHAHNGDCTIYFETFGDAGDPALLLVNGLGGQCINYPVAWCEMFAARGLFVIRFDNRDTGLSTHFTGAPVGEQGESYLLSDMAADGVAVLDALGIERAHIMGLSMGGMIVQTMAIEHPDRVTTLTSVMSASGEPGYGAPTPRALELIMAPPAADRAGYVAAALAGLEEWGSPGVEVAYRTAAAEASFDRCFDPGGTPRQFMAIRASGSRADALRVLDVPTLVIHGDHDNLVGIDAGRRTAELIPGARFEVIEGMGHDYPPKVWERWTTLVADHIAAHISA